MNPAAFRKEIEAGRVRPAYLFVGEEDLLKSEALEALCRATGGVARRFGATDSKADEMLEARSNLSLLEPVAAIVVRDAARLPEAQAEMLRVALASGAGPPVILWDVALDRRKKLFAEVSRSGGLVEFAALKRPEAVRWLRAEASRVGHRMDEAAASLLVELLGTGLILLRSTVERLSLAVGAKGAIGIEEITRQVPEARAHAFWELQNAVALRDGARAIRLFRVGLERGDSPHAMVGGLVAELRRLALARELGRGTTAGDAASVLGLPPFRAEKLLQASRRFPAGALEEAILGLADVDRNLKSGLEDAVALLESWLLSVCSPQSAGGGDASGSRKSPRRLSSWV